MVVDGRTLSRPDFRELSPFDFNNILGGFVVSTHQAIRATSAERKAELRARENRLDALSQEIERILATPPDLYWFTKSTNLVQEAADLDRRDHSHFGRIQELAARSFGGLSAVSVSEFRIGARFVCSTMT